MRQRRLSLRHVEAYRAVSVSGSMTEAARRIHTSQPQISRLISQLESIVGFVLFQRNGSRLTATREGERFSKDVEQTFAGLAGLEASAARIRSFSAGRLTVAAMPRLAGGMLARAVARFKSEFPDTLVSIHSGDAASVHSWISSGECDVGLAMHYANAEGVRVQRICTIDCVAVLPPEHPLCAHAVIRPAHLDGQRFISFPAGSPLRRRTDAILTTAGVQPYVTVEASLGASVCALVAAGQGISLINPIAATEEQMLAGLELRPFEPNIPLEVVLMFPEGQERSRLVDAFADCARVLIEADVSRQLGQSADHA